MLTREGVAFYDQELEPITKEMERVQWDVAAAEKGGYEHFMMKEICEQPEALRKTISPRMAGRRLSWTTSPIRISIPGPEEGVHRGLRHLLPCGSGGEIRFRAAVENPLEVDVASEFRYRDPILDDKTLVIIISQSGETADTLAALRMAKQRGCRILSIVNVVGSTIANESDDVLYTWAGRRSPWPPPRPTAPSWR